MCSVLLSISKSPFPTPDRILKVQPFSRSRSALEALPALGMFKPTAAEKLPSPLLTAGQRNSLAEVVESVASIQSITTAFEIVLSDKDVPTVAFQPPSDEHGNSLPSTKAKTEQTSEISMQGLKPYSP